MLVDILGYTALAIAMLSFMQNNMYILRMMGVSASVLFFSQAYLIGETSLMVANVCFATIHLYWIYKYKVVDKVVK